MASNNETRARGAEFTTKPLFMVTRRHQQWQQPQDCPLLIERVDDVQETPNDFTSFQRQGLRQLQQNASRTQLGQPYPLPDPQNARFPPWFASLPSHDVLDVDQYMHEEFEFRLILRTLSHEIKLTRKRKIP